jgi:preprotein translocase subunit SecA
MSACCVQYRRNVQAINALESRFEGMDDATLRDQTRLLKERHAAGETLDALLPEAFAAVREASKRVLKHASLRRAADRRHGAARRRDR